MPRRRIADPATPESEDAPAEENEQQEEQKPEQESATFVKNQLGEVISFKDGTKYTLASTKETITDPRLIKRLREAAAIPGNPYKLFEQ